MGTAILIKDVSEHFNGEAKVYRLGPPLKYTDWEEIEHEYEFVIVSAISCAFDHGGSETFIFPATEEGEIADWDRLPGSARGTLSHAEVLSNAGYTIT